MSDGIIPTVSKDEAVAIAREILGDLSEHELLTVLWRETDYPFKNGDESLGVIRDQLIDYKGAKSA